MEIGRLKVLSAAEIKTIHQNTLGILSEVGLRVELKVMRNLLSDAGCNVDEGNKLVKFQPDFIEKYVAKAPREFIICGADPAKQWRVSPETQYFGGLGTPISINDLETGAYRQTTLQDQIDHLVLFDHLEHVVFNQMDIWPHDIPMHTIHVESIRAWMKNCTKSFGYFNKNRQ